MSKCVNFINFYLKEYLKKNQKEFYCNILKSSQDRLQEYAIKNRSSYLKKVEVILM